MIAFATHAGNDRVLGAVLMTARIWCLTVFLRILWILPDMGKAFSVRFVEGQIRYVQSAALFEFPAPSQPFLLWMFVAALLLCSLCGTFLAHGLNFVLPVFVLFWMLKSLDLSLFHGEAHLIHGLGVILAAFSLLDLLGRRRETPFLSSLAAAVIRWQVVVMYAGAAWIKTHDPSWSQEGTAVAVVLKGPYSRFPALFEGWIDLVSPALTVGVLLWEFAWIAVLVPDSFWKRFGIDRSPATRVLLSSGVVIHALWALLLRFVPAISLVMICGYPVIAALARADRRGERASARPLRV